MRHYFRADFITAYDVQARAMPVVLAAGTALLGDGRVLIVLDVEELLRPYGIVAQQ